MKPYTYYIRWTALGKNYYGVKYGRDANPDTFWVNYHTSSNYVKEMREKHGEPDIIQVRKTFDCKVKAQLHEKTVLRRLNVPAKDEWLNKKIDSPNNPFTITEESRKKMSKAGKGRKLTDETKQKMREAALGRKHSAETKEKLRLIQIEKMTGRKHSPETIEKMRQSALRRKKS